MQTEQIIELGTVPIRGSRRYRIWSKNIKAHFIIDVAYPPNFIAGNNKLPILFVTDGNICFPAAAGISNALVVEPNGPPPMCVVGIGYDISGDGENAEHLSIRTRDLTPCPDKAFETMMRQAPEPYTWREDIIPGGADKLVAFILEELTPWLSENYNVDPDNRTITGISLGGLFVLNTLFTYPQAFNKYIAISPAIWWADRYLLRLEQEFASKHVNTNVSLYMAVGELEEVQDQRAKMVSNFNEMNKRIRGRNLPSLRISSDILAEETHMSVFSPAFSRALRSLFSKQSRDESWAQLES